ncbi:uncharacterized protein LOC116985324 [Amblyraja radiata]|uniref:uncharacterized protein LOC116985324 n=1 Tax=Amblyraja radiata TaxID=386614 RepID=UPI0014039422|nr:uncharacterized protein LOC116985324 [Amblyraja radiata]
MVGLKPPGPLSMQGNSSKNDKDWIRTFQLYEAATELTTGPAAQEIYETFRFAPEECDNIQPLKNKFQTYCEPKKNLTVTRYIFNTRNQRQRETFSSYLTAVKSLSNDCEFDIIHDSLLRDRIVCGISSQPLREKLLQCHELTLEKCSDMCLIAEAAAEQMKQIAPTAIDTEETVDYVKRDSAKRLDIFPDPPVNRAPNSRPRPRQHDRLIRQKAGGWSRDVRDIEFQMNASPLPEPVDDDVDVFYIDAVIESTHERGQMCSINNVNIEFKLDSGAQVDILPEHLFRKTGLALLNTNVTLRSFSGHTMKPVGQAKGNVKVGKKEYRFVFQIVRRNVKPIFGKLTCEKLGLLVRKEAVDGVSASSSYTARIIEENRKLFQGLGRLKIHEYNIALQENVQPKQNPPRTIPYKIRDKVKAELERIESLGVIKPVSEPTDWVNSMTVVNKPNGEVRICLDPRDLNVAIRWEHLPMPTFENIAGRMVLEV